MVSLLTASEAVQVTLLNTMLGVGIGIGIEKIMPAFSEDVTLTTQLVETALQASLNGIAVAVVSSLQSGSVDPTAGAPFVYALYEVQPEMRQRIVSLAGLTASWARSVVPKAAVPLSGE